MDPPGGSIGARGIDGARSCRYTLTMGDAGDRSVAVWRDDARVLTGLALLLDWHVGRSLVQIAGGEMRA
jgi:hypothetical protein